MTDKRSYCRKLRVIIVGAALLAEAFAFFCVGLTLVYAAQAEQANSAPLSFEVASVRPTQPPCKDSGFMPTPDGMHILCFPLQIVLQQAYGIYDSSRIVGLPGWVNSSFYDIEAKVGESHVASYSKLAEGQRSRMLQALLEDRFQLKAHRETKELPAYALVVAKSGSKLVESKPDETAAKSDPMAGPMMLRRGRGEIMSRSSRLKMFPRFLSQEVGRPVIDRTGLMGTYDFTLRWTSDPGTGANAAGADSTAADAGPSIFTALQEQLGLKLEPITTPLDVLIVDHIEKPSAN